MKNIAKLYGAAIFDGVGKLAGVVLVSCAISFGLLLGVTLFVRMGGGAI